MKNTVKKLSLSKETLRSLAPEEQSLVAGGASTVFQSLIFCSSMPVTACGFLPVMPGVWSREPTTCLA